VAALVFLGPPKPEAFQSGSPAPAPAVAVANSPAPASVIPSNAVQSLAPAPVSYIPTVPPTPPVTSLTDFDIRRETEQTNAIKAINSDFSSFKTATTGRLDTADGFLRDVVRNVADLSIREKNTAATVNGLQVAIPQYQALTEPGWVSMPGIIRPPGSTSERPTYPAASSVNPNDIEAYLQDLVKNRGFSGP
jgi:hypothetical protein